MVLLPHLLLLPPPSSPIIIRNESRCLMLYVRLVEEIESWVGSEKKKWDGSAVVICMEAT
jgi:hypothetical protein